MITKTEQDAILALARFGSVCLHRHRVFLGSLDGDWLRETAITCGVLEAHQGELLMWYVVPNSIAKMMVPDTLERALKKATALPESIQEAINSGDGS